MIKLSFIPCIHGKADEDCSSRCSSRGRAESAPSNSTSNLALRAWDASLTVQGVMRAWTKWARAGERGELERYNLLGESYLGATFPQVEAFKLRFSCYINLLELRLFEKLFLIHSFYFEACVLLLQEILNQVGYPLHWWQRLGGDSCSSRTSTGRAELAPPRWTSSLTFHLPNSIY